MYSNIGFFSEISRFLFFGKKRKIKSSKNGMMNYPRGISWATVIKQPTWNSSILHKPKRQSRNKYSPTFLPFLFLWLKWGLNVCSRTLHTRESTLQWFAEIGEPSLLVTENIQDFCHREYEKFSFLTEFKLNRCNHYRVQTSERQDGMDKNKLSIHLN